MHGSIRRRLTIAFIGLAIGPLLLVGATLAWQSFSTQEQQALYLQGEVAQRVSTQVGAFFDGLEAQLRIVGQIQGLQQLDLGRQQDILGELLAYQNAFDELILLDSQGKEQIHLARLEIIAAGDLGERAQADEFTVPYTSGEAYYGPIRFQEATGEPLMTISVPLFDVRTGSADGVLVSTVRIKRIWDLITNVWGQGQIVYIVDAQDRVVAHHNPSLVLRNTHFKPPDRDGIYPGLSGTRAVLAVATARFGQQEFDIVAEQDVSEALALANTTMYIIGAVIAFALVIASGLGFLIVRQIVSPIQSMATTAQAISAGDLSQQVKVTRQDELSVLAKAFNSMTSQLREFIGRLEGQNEHLRATVQLYDDYMSKVGQGDLTSRLRLDEDGHEANDPLIMLGHRLNGTTASLQQMIIQIRQAASDLGSATAEILVTTTQAAAGATEQSAAISQASATIDEVRTLAEQTARRAQAVAESARQTTQVSNAGQEIVANTITGVEEVRQKVESIARDALALSEQSQTIGQIIAAVKQIATQSNRLALNAAIEAARAGEAGRGFAVVAQEVRALANQSKESTTQIEDILSQIQQSVNTVVMATEEGMKGADAGMKLAGETGLSIQQLAEGVTGSTQAAEQIAAAAGQQQTGMEQIALAMENIHQVTAQNVMGSRQVEQSARNLNNLAGQLQDLVKQYEL